MIALFLPLDRYVAADFSIISIFPGDLDEVIQFCLGQLQLHHVRDDYRELIELTLIFLNVKLAYPEHFAPPGAMHHARWMSKALYSFKIWLFRYQLKLTKREESGLKEFCLFIAGVYTRCWIEADKAHLAPYNDLLLLKKTQRRGET